MWKIVSSIIIQSEQILKLIITHIYTKLIQLLRKVDGSIQNNEHQYLTTNQ